MTTCFSDTGRAKFVEALEPRRLMAASAWSDTIDNPYVPLAPGMTWVYKGVKDGEPERNRVVVLQSTKVIMGVTCTVVLDRVYTNGKLTERTHDWYAQDKQGNVWYFGEDSRDLENGKVVSTEGSWQAGVNGARPGIIMEAHPNVGDSYHQEFAAGVAEDAASIVSLKAKASTGFGTFTGCLQTREFSALEPDITEIKFYAPGIGFIRSQSSGGETEILKLISFIP